MRPPCSCVRKRPGRQHRASCENVSAWTTGGARPGCGRRRLGQQRRRGPRGIGGKSTRRFPHTAGPGRPSRRLPRQPRKCPRGNRSNCWLRGA
eukprot:746676-Hanusia_phi.AAC.3